MTTTKVGIEIEVRMQKAEAQIQALRSELDRTKTSAHKAQQSVQSFDKSMGNVRNSIAGSMGLVAGLTAAAMAADRMADRVIKLTGETDGAAGAWKRMAGEWREAGDQLLVAIDRLPLALRTIERELGGASDAADDQGESVGVLTSVWDGYIKKLSPLSGKDSFVIQGINAIGEAVDNLALKTARASMGPSLVAGLEKARDAAAIKEINRLHRESARDTKILNDLFEINANATEKMARASERHVASRRREVDLFKAERAEFQSQLGEVEMGRAGSSLRTAKDRDKFSTELDQAKMAEAGINAKKRQAEFEEDEHQKAMQRRQETMDMLSAEQEAVRQAEEQKRIAIQQTTAAQMQAADIMGQVTGGTIGLAGEAATAYAKSERAREAATKASAGGQAITIGVLESVKAAASFAGFNYVEGAMHTAAAAFAFARGGMLLHQAGSANRGGGGASSGGMSGFRPGIDHFSESNSGGDVQSTSGGSGRPKSGGPISEAEESVQRSGRGGRPLAANGPANGPTYHVNVQHIGAIDDQTGIKIVQAIKRVERKAGKVTS